MSSAPLHLKQPFFLILPLWNFNITGDCYLFIYCMYICALYMKRVRCFSPTKNQFLPPLRIHGPQNRNTSSLLWPRNTVHFLISHSSFNPSVFIEYKGTTHSKYCVISFIWGSLKNKTNVRWEKCEQWFLLGEKNWVERRMEELSGMMEILYLDLGDGYMCAYLCQNLSHLRNLHLLDINYIPM